MKTKLTLRLDDDLIELAKEEAETRGVSISQMVANFFRGLRSAKKPTSSQEVGPITGELLGMLKGAKLSEDDRKRHLEKKHR